MYHPTTRVLTVLELLQARGRLSGPEIAERLEVDLRTVRRYVTMLQDLGIPVETERGRHGGYRLRPGFRLPPLLFTDDEALAATLGLMAARRFGLAAGAAAVEGALAKLERALPPDVRDRVAAVQRTLTIDAARPPDAPATADVLALGAAAHHGHRVRIAYTNAQGETSARVVDPYGLVQFGRRWYLPAWCHMRAGPRLFRLDRIRPDPAVGGALHATAGLRPPRLRPRGAGAGPRLLAGGGPPRRGRRGGAPTDRAPRGDAGAT